MKKKNDYDYLDLDGYSLPGPIYYILSFIAFCGVGKLIVMIVMGEFG